MDEQELGHRLVEAAAVGQPGPTLVSEDIARGRRSRRRRAAAMTGVPLAAVAVIGGVGAAGGLPGQVLGDEPKEPLGVAGGGTVTPPRTGIPETTATLPGFGPGQAPLSVWRNELYDLARRHLDPAHDYLNYRTQSLEMSGAGDGGQVFGIKLGWEQRGDSGEGMVQLAVASPGHGRMLGCNDVAPCRSVHVPGFGTVRLGGDPLGHGGYEVVVRQSDGETAQVLVTPLFGNDSLTPTEARLVGLHRVLALAEDPAFDLPR